jgi:hypothetical protein
MDGINAPHQWSGLRSACSQAGQDGGYQLASVLTVHGLMVQVVEHGGVLGYLVWPGDLDCRRGGFERDGIFVEDPKSDGGDRAPLHSRNA